MEHLAEGARDGVGAADRHLDAGAVGVDRCRSPGQQFELVQQIFAENLPVLYFAAPRMYFAHGARLQGVVPSIQPPPVLWNADSLSVSE